MVENSCIELHEDRCKFYVDELQDGKYGHCLIIGRGNRPIRNVKDRNGNRITEDQLAWFEANCLSYPTVRDMERAHQLLPECGFRFEEV